MNVFSGLLIIIVILSIIFFYLRTKQEENYVEENHSSSLYIDRKCRQFSLAEIKSATQNFDEKLVLGKGGFGKVYKGIIDNGESTVAIKRLASGSSQGASEFRAEIEMLSKFRHSHLVSLIGYCNSCHEMIIVYEYMPGGTLADSLYKIVRSNGDKSSHFSWVQRLKVCIGAARGLEYLHTGTGILHRVIHRDVKTSNILLDENREAKIADFGLSKIGPKNQPCTYVSTNVKGTFGYLDPEYYFTRRLTRKSDVYAFGVVLFEVLCGRAAVDKSLPDEQWGLAGWAKQCVREGRVHQIVDPSLRGSILENSLSIFVQIADQCLNNNSGKRPTMAEVISKLESALALQETTGSLEWDANSCKEMEANSANDVGDDDEEQMDGIMPLDYAIRNKSQVEPAKKTTFVKKVQLIFSTKPQGIFSVPESLGSSIRTPDEHVFKKPSRTYDPGKVLLSISGESNGANKQASQMSSFFGKAGIIGLEVLDTLGSSMTSFNLNANIRFDNMGSRRTKLCILTFEVANTIARGSTLVQSLSEENIQLFVKEILLSEGVQQLISADMTELLSIAAADKRDEFDVFSREVIRFGDLCIDKQWHNLGRYFSTSYLDPSTKKLLRKEAEITMQNLAALAQHTSELYNELHVLERIEQDYQQKLDEVKSLHVPGKGELVALRSELKHQRKLVRRLQKKSLWSMSLEEVMGKLSDIVIFIHQTILEVFGNNVDGSIGQDSDKMPERLGVTGLDLHYAKLITQINNITSCPTTVSLNIRESLYNGLPTSVKTGLRSCLHTASSREALTITQIKAEMEKTLLWLVPVATDTIKARQNIGRFGGWANTGNEFSKRTSSNTSLVRIQTLYHADKQKMDLLILDLVTWLHRLISVARHSENVPKPLAAQLPTHKSPGTDSELQLAQISLDDRILLEDVTRKIVFSRRSRSEKAVMVQMTKAKVWPFSKSTGSSSRSELGYGKQRFGSDTDMLDVLDGLDTASVCAI